MLLALATMRRSLQWGSVFTVSTVLHCVEIWWTLIVGRSAVCLVERRFTSILFAQTIICRFNMNFYFNLIVTSGRLFDYVVVMSIAFSELDLDTARCFHVPSDHIGGRTNIFLYQCLDGPDKRNTVISSYYKLGLWFKVGGFYWALLLGWQLSAYEFL